MTLKEFKKQLEHYDDNLQVKLNFSDDFCCEYEDEIEGVYERGNDGTLLIYAEGNQEKKQ